MVDLGKRNERERENSMEMGLERSRPSLHNFKMPPLQWGNQKLLRCMNVNPNDENLKCSDFGVKNGLIGRRELEHESRRWMDKFECKERLKKSPPLSPAAGVGSSALKSKAESDGIEAIREKLMLDLQEAAEKMKDAILREGLEKEEPTPAADAPAPPDVNYAVRPWNLRTRRAACKAPNGTNGAIGAADGTVSGRSAKGLKFDERRKPKFSPFRTESKSGRLGGEFMAEVPTGENRERPKFSISLSWTEMDEDFRVMTGHRPPRRPKKRPKIVQKELDTLFPGLWLTEVTADIYEVPDAPETRKR